MGHSGSRCATQGDMGYLGVIGVAQGMYMGHSGGYMGDSGGCMGNSGGVQGQLRGYRGHSGGIGATQAG